MREREGVERVGGGGEGKRRKKMALSSSRWPD